MIVPLHPAERSASFLTLTDPGFGAALHCMKGMHMTSKLLISILAVAVSTGAAFAKAHDQGVADGSFPDSTSDVVDSIEGPGISSVVSGGARGDGASTNKGGNRVEPVVGNGANKE